MTTGAARLDAQARFKQGCVIPAHPLALDAERRLDERRQRALTRYYLAAGAGGVAVGVHTTQFAIRDPRHGLYRPVLALALETLRAELARRPRPFVSVAGVIGDTAQAVREAETAAALGCSIGTVKSQHARAMARLRASDALAGLAPAETGATR